MYFLMTEIEALFVGVAFNAGRAKGHRHVFHSAKHTTQPNWLYLGILKNVPGTW